MHDKLSDVMHETGHSVFIDEEFAAHLERVAASEDDLPRDDGESGSGTLPGRHRSN